MEMLNTELDAINLCLSGIGREPVASIDTADLDSAMARNTIDQVSLDLQGNGGRGWWFNRESGWKLEPGTNGRITLPNNTLSIIESRGSFYDIGNRLTVRGRYVYDTDQHTYDLSHAVGKDGNIEFALILLLAYDEIPAMARSAIAWRARRLFADDTVGDVNQYEINIRNEQQAVAALETEHRRTSRSNYLLHNDRVRSSLGRIGGHNNMYR